MADNLHLLSMLQLKAIDAPMILYKKFTFVLTILVIQAMFECEECKVLYFFFLLVFLFFFFLGGGGGGGGGRFQHNSVCQTLMLEKLLFTTESISNTPIALSLRVCLTHLSEPLSCHLME